MGDATLDRVVAVLKAARGDGEDHLEQMRLTTKSIHTRLEKAAGAEQTRVSVQAVRDAVKALTERGDVSMRHDMRGRPAYMWRNDKDWSEVLERKAIVQRVEVLSNVLGLEEHISTDSLGHYVLTQAAMLRLVEHVALDARRARAALLLNLQVCVGPSDDRPCPHGPNAVAHFLSVIRTPAGASSGSRPTCCHCMDIMRHTARQSEQVFSSTVWASARAQEL